VYFAHFKLIFLGFAESQKSRCDVRF
jgi:hypothetical protein